MALEFARLQGGREAAIADAINFDIDLRGVGRDDRNALLTTAWQHVSFARKAHEGCTIWHIDGEIGGFVQSLADFGGQSGADLYDVALAVRQAFDAQLFAFLHEVLGIFAVDRDELCNIRLGAREIFRELQADAGRCRLGVGLVVHHPEAVLGAQFVVIFAHRLVVGEVDAHFHGVDGWAPVRAAF